MKPRFERWSVIVVTLGAIALLLSSRALPPLEAAGGGLDPSFGNGGKVITRFTQFDNQGYALALQKDGKIVAAGSVHTGKNFDFGVARFNTNGGLDPTFGDGGKLVLEVSEWYDEADCIAVQPDGKILVGGSSTVDELPEFSLIRLNTDGTLDKTFGEGGKVFTRITAGQDAAMEILLLPDGKIVLFGLAYTDPDAAYALARYNADGSLDQTFGQGGKTLIRIESFSYAYAAALQKDGKIVAAGNVRVGQDSVFAIVRFNSNGSLDGTFGNGGKTLTRVGASSQTYSVAIQDDGKIVAAGVTTDTSSQPAKGGSVLVRYNTDGTLDPVFGKDGIVTLNEPDNVGLSSDVAIQKDGKIVAAGAAEKAFAVGRFTATGGPDVTFGNNGIATLMVGKENDLFFDVAVAPDGKIIAVGSSMKGAEGTFVLARFLG